MQSRRVSAIEAVTNVTVGYAVSLIATRLVLPAFGYAITKTDAIWISAAFTAISLTRSYILRRLFNHLGKHQ